MGLGCPLPHKDVSTPATWESPRPRTGGQAKGQAWGCVPSCISGDPHQSLAGWRPSSLVCPSGQGPPRESRAVSGGDPAPSHAARAAASRPVGVPDAGLCWPLLRTLCPLGGASLCRDTGCKAVRRPGGQSGPLSRGRVAVISRSLRCPRGCPGPRVYKSTCLLGARELPGDRADPREADPRVRPFAQACV